MAWYYSTGSGRNGPITEPELVTLIRSGTVTPGTLAWTDGQADWQPLSSLRPDLFSNASATAAAVPSLAGTTLAGAGKDLAVQQMREGLAPGAENLQYAGFWIRFCAKFVDGLILMVVLMPIMLLTGGLSTDGQAAGPSPIVLLLQYVLPFLYNGFMVGKYGATLGKKALGLKVLDAEGAPVSTGRGFGRAAAEWVSGLTFTIGYIIAAFDGQKRALHDHIASTRVVKTR